MKQEGILRFKVHAQINSSYQVKFDPNESGQLLADGIASALYSFTLSF
jgi:hypothetical protein